MKCTLGHVSVLVADTSIALGFYHDLLGLGINTARPDLGYPGAWLNLDDGRQIHLLELPNPDASIQRPEHGGRDRHVAMHVEALDVLIDKLETAGVGYTMSRSGRRALFCRDPDGNALEFIEAV